MAADMALPWPVGIPQLKRLDELLRCGICYEFLSTSMVTACSHNYCSLCIRQYLSYKPQCPACFQLTTTQHLRNNRLLDEIIGLFPALRDKVAHLNQTSKGNVITGYLETSDLLVGTKEDQTSTCNPGQSVPTTRTPGSKQLEYETASPRKPSSVKDSPVLPRYNRVTTATPKRNLGMIFSPIRSGAPFRESQPEPCSSKNSSSNKNQAKFKSSLGSLFGSQSASRSPSTQSSSETASGHFSIFGDSKSTNSESNEEDGARVPCPVCSVEVPERNINLHLDACLQHMEQGDDVEIIVQTPKRRPLPKLVYTLLSEKQMRQKLKEIGLSIQGDKQSLVTRHRRYTTLYNAECDAAEPCPVSDLVRHVEREEREKARGTSSQSIFTYDRKTAPEVIEKEQKNYLKKNDNHFTKLIDEVRRRRAGGSKKKGLKKCEVQDEKGRCEQVPHDMATSLISSEICTSLLNDEVLKNKSADSDSCENTQLDEDEENIEKHLPYSIESSTQQIENAVNSNKHQNEIKNSCELNRKEISGTFDIEVSCTHTNVVEGKSKVESLHQSPEKSLKPTQDNCSTEYTRDGLLHENMESKEKTVDPSPDIFSASPSTSDGSGESVSLLLDCEPLTPPQLASLSGHLCESDEEDLIPARQPETRHDNATEDSEEVKNPPGQQANTPSMQATKPPQDCHQPRLAAPEDADYVSQLLQGLDSEDIDFYIPRRLTRQSSRKRKSSQKEETTSQRRGRKRKK